MCGSYFTMIAELKADGFVRWWSYLPPGENKSRVENWINTERRESVKLIVPPPYHSCAIGAGIELRIYKAIKP